MSAPRSYPAAGAGALPVPASPRRGAAWVSFAVLVGGVVLTFVAARVIGPSFDEERRFAGVRHAGSLVHAIADFGPSSMVSSSARGVYDDLVRFGVWPGLISAWTLEAFGRSGTLDTLVAARVGWLLLTALAPWAVYSIVAHGHGRLAGVLAACALFAFPRWTHAAATAREPAVVAAVWLVLLATYLSSVPLPRGVRRLRGTRFRCSGPLFAGVLGLGVSADLATLWVLPIVVIHYWGCRPRATWRSFRRGRAPLPSVFLWALGLSPVVLLLVTPQLWRGGASGAAEWLLAPLAPSIEPTLYGGSSVVSVRDVPDGYAVRWLVATVPAVAGALAVCGFVLLSRDAFRRRSSKRGRAAVAPGGLGLLLLLVLAAVVLGPFFTPRVFVRFPPRVEIALPFLAMAAAVALDRAAARVVGEARSARAAIPAALALAASGLLHLPLASASFGLLAGGTRGAVKTGGFPVGDGSDVAPLSRAIDGLGLDRVTIDAPEVPKGYWALLNQSGRMKTRVDPGHAARGALRVLRGPRDGAVATVEVGGATLWSLLRS